MNIKQKKWLHTQVENLYMKGYTQQQISDKLQIRSQTTISRILQDLQAQAKNNVHDMINTELPLFYSRAFKSYNELLTLAWETLEVSQDVRIRHSYILMIADLLKRQEDIVTAKNVVKDFVEFIEDSKKQSKEDLENAQQLYSEIKQKEMLT